MRRALDKRVCDSRWIFAAFVLAAAVPARADATAYVGAIVAGSARPTVGVAFGQFGSRAIGGEVDYWHTVAAAPNEASISAISANVILQSSSRTHRYQFYGVAGFGVYGETLQGTGSGEVGTVDIGGGTKLTLAGRMKVRLDYRVFLLGEATDAAAGFVVHRHPQRLTAGFTVAF